MSAHGWKLLFIIIIIIIFFNKIYIIILFVRMKNNKNNNEIKLNKKYNFLKYIIITLKHKKIETLATVWLVGLVGPITGGHLMVAAPKNLSHLKKS